VRSLTYAGESRAEGRQLVICTTRGAIINRSDFRGSKRGSDYASPSPTLGDVNKVSSVS
jgi:hypothetical protein